MRQLELFESDVLRFDHLVAPDSPKQAYYKLWLEVRRGRHRVRKESGTRRHRLNERVWPFDSLAMAERFYQKKIKEKTGRPRGKSRQYVVAGPPES